MPLHAESCGPLVREDGHNESAILKENSFVAITQGTNDSMSDLFPQKSKAVQEQQLDIAEVILAQVDEEIPSMDNFGDKLLEHLAKHCYTIST